ncbi:MAG: hypothetical protein ACKVXR_06650 [Planctomycetota bacterium]
MPMLLPVVLLLCAAQEPTLRVQLIDNGDFREAPAAPDGREAARLPWWQLEGGSPQVVEREGAAWLVLQGGATARQPFAAHAPTAAGISLRGIVRGAGRLTLVDGRGERVTFDVGSADGEPAAFEVSGEDRVPRFQLELGSRDGAVSQWAGVEALVPLPLPPEADLRAEIVSVLTWIFDTWRAKGADLEGRQTAFVSARFDAVTGKTIDAIPGGIFPLQLFQAELLEFHDKPAWRAALELYLADYLTLGLHEKTGLPRKWDTRADLPLDSTFAQIGMDLSFLIGIAQRGPEAWRDRARAAAAKMGETILAHGVLPDGNVAAEYRPADAAISTNVPQLRRLDVPCQLARLGRLLGDERYLRAARNAVAELEYTHFWSGTWSEIDPGFDDDFGHYGARAVEMLRAYPAEPAFRGLVESGWRRYAPLWRDSTRFGGTVAADQVRCWALLADCASFQPDLVPDLAPRIAAAARAHFKGEQYDGGAWGDVTFFEFEPKTGLQVGDLPGTPANLLNGLAVAHEAGLPSRREELRAMYTAVLRSTLAEYRKPYGCLTTQRVHEGVNPAGGELRLLPGLVRMLRQLSTGR